MACVEIPSGARATTVCSAVSMVSPLTIADFEPVRFANAQEEEDGESEENVRGILATDPHHELSEHGASLTCEG